MDGDGLNNGDELEYGTEMLEADSDYDDLEDGFEVYTFGSDPALYDTDEDGLGDGDEYVLGTDPNSADSDSDGISDNEEIYQQSIIEPIDEEEKPEVTSVTVSFGSSENIQNTTYIYSVYGTDTWSSQKNGLVGAPVNIESSSDFDTAVITFTYNEDELGDTDENDLKVVWLDEESYSFIVLDSVVDAESNTVSVETTHFSTYMLVDGEKENILPYTPILDYSIMQGDANVQVVLAVDSSSAIAPYDPDGRRISAACAFVDALSETTDYAAVVDYDLYHYYT